MLNSNKARLMSATKALAVICVISSIAACKHKHEAKVSSTTETQTRVEESRDMTQTDESEGLRLRPMDEATQRASGYQAVYFDFDESQIRNDQRRSLEVAVQTLQERPTDRLILEGHCDERGTVEYNLLLGERRAAAVKTFLMSIGDIQSDRLQTLSKGEEEPAVDGHSESAWAQNRRVEFVRAE